MHARSNAKLKGISNPPSALTFVALTLALGLVAATASVATTTPARAASDSVCYKMLVLRVIDGDTVYGYIDTSDPIIALRASLRLADVNAPEKGGRAKCSAERALGQQAKSYAERILGPALEKRSRQLVRVCGLKRGKYALRRVGRLEVNISGNWRDLGDLMLRRGLVRRSKNGRRTTNWCSGPDAIAELRGSLS